MPKFSKRSKAKLETCHPLLQKLFNEVIKHQDCTIIEGVRSLEKQKEYVRNGVSKTLNSKHLEQTDGYSYAVDCIKYPINWNDSARNYMFAGYVKGVAASLGIGIRMGADWNGNFTAKDQSFHDLPHFELAGNTNDAMLKESKPTPSRDILPDGPSDQDIEDKLKGLE